MASHWGRKTSLSGSPQCFFDFVCTYASNVTIGSQFPSGKYSVVSCTCTIGKNLKGTLSIMASTNKPPDTLLIHSVKRTEKN